MHLFEPHSPYGNPAEAGPAARGTTTRSRKQIGRWDGWLTAWAIRAPTLVVVAGDHGEAFGEHGEISHSLFIYDTTLRVPLVLSGAGVAPDARRVAVSLVDVAPTIVLIAGPGRFDADGGIL